MLEDHGFKFTKWFQSASQRVQIYQEQGLEIGSIGTSFLTKCIMQRTYKA